MHVFRMVHLAFLGAVLVACEGESATCSKARGEASDAWRQLKEKAGGFKHRGAVGYEDMDERQKADHLKTWTEIETQAELLSKSFAFSKITWDTAEPAKKKLNETFEQYPHKKDYGSVSGSLSAANTQHDAAKAACQ